MILSFKYLRYKVKVRSVFTFFKWYFRYISKHPIRDVIKLFYFSINSDTHQELFYNWNWCSQFEDGNFRIYFDYSAGKVYKLSKTNLILNEKSLLANHLFKFSPIVSQQDLSYNTLIIERLIKGSPLRLDVKKSSDLIRKLFFEDIEFKVSVYTSSEFKKRLEGDWLQIFSNIFLNEGLLFVGGYVHGDLIPQNIIVKDDGTISIIDWEYSGFGPGLYDLWYLLFDTEGRSNHKSPLIISTLSDFLLHKGLDLSEEHLHQNINFCWEVWQARREN